ncbi:MAG: HEAT repeat domain-containing protein, partial [Candidatus Omnitrophica bacterium]|nr:HEAT repeat domain-containing protein [Candidatus Omnitrophota bacterium]
MPEKSKLWILDFRLSCISKLLFFMIVFCIVCYAQHGIKEILINGTTAQKISVLKKIIAEKNTKILPDIFPALDDPSADVRILASEALLKLGDHSFTTSYQKELSDPHWQVRLNGIKGIVQYGSAEEVLADLRKALDDSYWQIRFWAATGIGKFGDETMIRTILSHLSDENFQVRAELFWALRRILCRDEARYVFKKLSDSDVSKIFQSLKIEDIRTQINGIWALEATTDARVIPALIEFLNSPFDEVKIQAVWALENLKANKGFEFLRAKLLEPSIKLKIESIKTLVRLGDDESVPAMVEKLEDPDENVRVFALWALKKFEDFSSFPAIVRKLGDKSERVRSYAFNIIAESKNANFIPALEDAALNRKLSLDERTAAVELLGKIASPEESLFFDSIKNQPEPLLRKKILEEWYNVNQSDSAFLMYLDFASRIEPEKSVRNNAQIILKRVLNDIKKDLAENKEIKRSQALERLSFFKENPLIAPLVKEMLTSNYQDIRMAGLEILPFQTKAATFSALKDIMKENSQEMRKLAIIGMGKAKIIQSVPLLLAQLKDEDPEIQVCAAYSLAVLGNGAGLGAAIRNIQNQDIQIQSMAVETIALLNVGVATGELLRLLENAELEIKLKAAWALSRAGEEKGLYTLVNISRQDIEPLRTQARHYLADRKIPQRLRAMIPEIQKKQETLLTGMPEARLKSVVATKLSQLPVIDGNSGDRIWKTLLENKTMIYISGEKVLAEVQTSVITGFDNEKIYFLFFCNDPEASSITFDSRDFITICINPDSSEKRWYQYTLHATNFLKYAYVW